MPETAILTRADQIARLDILREQLRADFRRLRDQLAAMERAHARDFQRFSAALAQLEVTS